MNLLIDDMPDTVLGVAVNTDFRAMVQLEQLIHDPEISATEKVQLGLQLLYTNGMPHGGITEAWNGLLWFYRGGEDAEPEAEEDRKKRPKQAPKKARRVYDFEQDAGRIYAAFRQVYGVDLQSTPLHWWAFRAMLFALPDSCLQGKVMGYRAIDVSKLKGPEKKRIQRLQQIYAIRACTTEAAMDTAERERKMLKDVMARYEEAIKWRAKQMTGSR